MINASTALSMLGGSASTSSSTMSALTAFTNYNKDQVAARTAFANSATVTSAIDAFKSDAKDIDTVDDLLGDRKTLSFVLSAFGLESEINNIGQLRAVLNSDPDDINSYANRLTDKRFGELAAFFDAPEFGTTRLRVSDKQTELIDKYLTTEFEKSIGEQNEAARDALFFLRRINDVETAYDILADSSLRSIVTDALNLPAEIANQSIERQAALIDAGIDLTKFQTSGAASGAQSALDVLNSDLDSIGEASSALLASQTSVDSVVDQLATLRDLYADYTAVVDPNGVNRDEIAVQKAAIPALLTQQGLVSAADLALTDTGDALADLRSLLARAQDAEDADELAAVQTSVAAVADRILNSVEGASYTDPNTGLTRNILLNGGSGSLPDGVSATDPTTRTTVDTDGTQQVTRSTDLSGFLADIAALRDAVVGATFDTLADDLAATDDLFDSADTALDAAGFLNDINGYSLSNALSSVNFATEIDTTSVARGLASVDDALSRVDTVQGILANIRAMTHQASSEVADLDAINSSYTKALTNLRNLIETSGTVSDGATTVTLDNLLSDGSASYSVLDGTVVQAEGGNLIASIVDALPSAITVDNLADLKAEIDGTLTDTLDSFAEGLTRDRRVIAFAAETIDPLGALDAQIRSVAERIATLTEASDDETNLLSPYASDLTITLGSLGSSLTIDAQPEFASSLADAFEGFQTTVLSGGSLEDRLDALNDALFAAGRVQSRLQAESYALTIQQEIATQKKTELEGEGGGASEFLEPEEYSSAALKFIQRYLVQKDLESSGVSVGTTSAATQMASQLSSILPAANSITSLLA